MVTTSMLSVTYLLRGGNHGLFEKNVLNGAVIVNMKIALELRRKRNWRLDKPQF